MFGVLYNLDKNRLLFYSETCAVLYKRETLGAYLYYITLESRWEHSMYNKNMFDLLIKAYIKQIKRENQIMFVTHISQSTTNVLCFLCSATHQLGCRYLSLYNLCVGISGVIIYKYKSTLIEPDNMNLFIFNITPDQRKFKNTFFV